MFLPQIGNLHPSPPPQPPPPPQYYHFHLSSHSKFQSYGGGETMPHQMSALSRNSFYFLREKWLKHRTTLLTSFCLEEEMVPMGTRTLLSPPAPFSHICRDPSRSIGSGVYSWDAVSYRKYPMGFRYYYLPVNTTGIGLKVVFF